MFIEESLGSVDTSKLVNVPRWSHPFKVETTSFGLPSAELKSIVQDRVRTKMREEQEILQAMREQQEQNALDEMALQMSSADFGSRSGAAPATAATRAPKPLAKSDAILVEEKRRQEQQKRIVEEQELASKKSRLAEIELSLKTVETQLESLNHDKHEMFVKLRQVVHLEEAQRAEAQRREEERRWAAEEAQRRMMTPSPTPLQNTSPYPYTPGISPSPTPGQAGYYPSTAPGQTLPPAASYSSQAPSHGSHIHPTPSSNDNRSQMQTDAPHSASAPPQLVSTQSRDFRHSTDQSSHRHSQNPYPPPHHHHQQQHHQQQPSQYQRRRPESSQEPNTYSSHPSGGGNGSSGAHTPSRYQGSSSSSSSTGGGSSGWYADSSNASSSSTSSSSGTSNNDRKRNYSQFNDYHRSGSSGSNAASAGSGGRAGATATSSGFGPRYDSRSDMDQSYRGSSEYRSQHGDQRDGRDQRDYSSQREMRSPGAVSNRGGSRPSHHNN